MKFILFNLVVTGALVFLIMDKNPEAMDFPGASEVVDKVDGYLDPADASPMLPSVPQPKPVDTRSAAGPEFTEQEITQGETPVVETATLPVESMLGDDMAPASERIVDDVLNVEPEPEAAPDTGPKEASAPAVPAPAATAPAAPRPLAVDGPVELAAAFEPQRAVPPPVPGLAPDVAKRRAEILGAPQPLVRETYRVSESDREAMLERRLNLQSLAEEMEVMAAEATLR